MVSMASVDIAIPCYTMRGSNLAECVAQRVAGAGQSPKTRVLIIDNGCIDRLQRLRRAGQPDDGRTRASNWFN